MDVRQFKRRDFKRNDASRPVTFIIHPYRRAHAQCRLGFTCKLFDELQNGCDVGVQLREQCVFRFELAHRPDAIDDL